MKPFMPVLMAISLMIGGKSAGATLSQTISDSDAYYLLNSNPNAYLIDVRTVPEWQAGHVGSDPGNVQYPGLFLESPNQKVFNIPIYLAQPYFDPSTLNPLFDQAIQMLFNSNDTLIFYCGSGKRAETAAETVVSALGFNYNNVYNVGTFSAWKSASLPYNSDSNGAWAPIAAAVPEPGVALLLIPGLGGLLAVNRMLFKARVPVRKV